MKKIMMLLLVLLGSAFAATDNTQYCLEQNNACFQENCYKVNGQWETNPDTGQVDCMYDKGQYTSSQISEAFGECMQKVQQCEDRMSGGTPSPGGSCCGSIIVVGLVGAAAFTQSRRR